MTEADSQLGRRVAETLSSLLPAGQIAAAARDVSGLETLRDRGARVYSVDYEDRASWIGAFEGVRRVALIASADRRQRSQHHETVLSAALEAGSVQRIVYSSRLLASHSRHPAAGQDRRTEQLIRLSGIPHSFARLGAVLDDYLELATWSSEYALVLGATRGRDIYAATREEYARAIATIVLASTAEPVYDLSRQQPFTLMELASVLTQHRGKPVESLEVAPDELRQLLVRRGLSEDEAAMRVATDDVAARGEIRSIPPTLSTLLGATGSLRASVLDAMRRVARRKRPR